MTVRNPSFSAYNGSNALPSGVPSWFQGPQTDAQMRAQSAMLAQQGMAQQAQAAQVAGPAVDPVANNWKHTIADTEGRGDATMNDPYTTAALARLQGVTSGQDVPYTQQVQNQMLARQADAGAAGMDAQRQMIENQQAALGGSMADPSAQAALRRLMAENQANNNANLGDIQTNAHMGNFDARNNAAMNMASMRGNQLSQANGQYNQAAHYYANQQITDPRFNATAGGGGWQSYGATAAPVSNGAGQYQAAYSAPMSGNSTAGRVTQRPTQYNNWNGAGNPQAAAAGAAQNLVYNAMPAFMRPSSVQPYHQPAASGQHTLSTPSYPQTQGNYGYAQTYAAAPGLSLSSHLQGPPNPYGRPNPKLPTY